jgi:hypothetical protein
MGEKQAQPRDEKARKSEQTQAMGEKHAQARDEKARKREQDKHG